MKPTLTFNCPEKWDNMKIGLISRYCESCSRDVQDFTKMSREEILHYLWTNRNTKVCGRIMKSQLDYHREEILVTIESYLGKNRNSNLSFFLLAAGALLALSCSPSGKSVPETELDPETYQLQCKQQKYAQVQALNAQAQMDTVEVSDKVKKLDQIDTTWESYEILGDLRLDPENSLGDVSSILRFADVMPEFEGGYSALNEYLKQELRYPEWEKKNKIEGTVFVSFVVDETGAITTPKIIRSVADSRNFDAEVVRVLQAMPPWKPGLVSNEPVAVEFTLPIRFKI